MLIDETKMTRLEIKYLALIFLQELPLKSEGKFSNLNYITTNKNKTSFPYVSRLSTLIVTTSEKNDLVTPCTKK